MDRIINVGSIIPCSEANGPGRRFVIWLQGCGRKCAGCINKDFQVFGKGTPMEVCEVLKKVRNAVEKYGIEGITLTGGEPLDQADVLEELVNRARNETGLNVFMFTGYKKDELESDAQMRVWELSDIVVSGRFAIELLETKHPWKGSSNQDVIFNNPQMKCFLPKERIVEVFIDEEGEVKMTGVVRGEENLVV